MRQCTLPRIDQLAWGFALAGIVASGVLIRLLGWSEWEFLLPPGSETPLPILANADGYFYLSLARDWLEGRYHDLAPWRVYPEAPARPDPVPLLVWFTALLASLTQQPLERVAAVLPALIGALVALPVALVARLIAGRWIALWAAGVAVLVPYFVHRTGLGWFDTDGLTVLLPLLQVALAAVLLENASRRGPRIALLLGYLGVTALFYLAWDQAPAVVAVLSSYPLLLVWATRWKIPSLRYGLPIMILAVLWMLPDTLPSAIQNLTGAARYVAAPEAASAFSPIALAIGEQQRLPLALVAEESAGGLLPLVLAGVGLLYLALLRPLPVLLLAPFGAIALMGLVHAERFLIFATPLVALGAAGVLLGIRQLLATQERRLRGAVVALAGMVFVTVLSFVNLQMDRTPIIPLAVVEPMTELALVLPEDAVIWNFCDYGYALIYWTRAVTTCDGSSHSALRRTAMAAPLHAESPEVAAGFMRFFLAHGEDGIRRVMALHDDHWPRTRQFLQQAFIQPSRTRLAEWLEHDGSHAPDEARELAVYLMPDSTRPVYLVLDRQTMRNTHWWYWFSTWNPEQRRGVHPYYILFPRVPAADVRGLIQDDQGLFTIDTASGIVRFRNQQVQLRHLAIAEQDARQSRQFPSEEFWMMDVVYAEHSGYAVLHDPLTKDTMGHRLFIDRSESPLFERVYTAAPELQAWRVHAPP